MDFMLQLRPKEGNAHTSCPLPKAIGKHIRRHFEDTSAAPSAQRSRPRAGIGRAATYLFLRVTPPKLKREADKIQRPKMHPRLRPHKGKGATTVWEWGGRTPLERSDAPWTYLSPAAATCGGRR